ncbi:septal ring lytic transglycosylase RlpA family protein [Parasphingopyxis sp. CP4]|uniref:septal ring lytic transglycosylase RlpA family protein n=1 Tax=Parasphingopyxis sp. CP4 TaxID=2724527 RepID=UPI0015A40915|nr:septal ring lytic transglycosylase RlpA family protein [Parasphingopyxis sp. CP4]QLC21486.1 septal ring lytic transglycosylase RlpA family protein [Parasphingopyxis sp. CP4]
MRLFDSRHKWLAGLAVLALAGCGGGSRELPPASAGGQGPITGELVSDTPVRIGAPYTIDGRTYTPSDPSHYDEVGLASFYGEELGGRPTANGEIFRPAGISAAHRTLPLPSYVEVTSLQTGRSILVRVNDRGPFAGNRIIDLSIGAARLLGFVEQGTAPVRVRRVQPNEGDRTRLRGGQAARPRLDASPQLLTALRAQYERGGGIIPQAVPSPDAPATTRTVNAPPSAPTNGNPSGPGVSWENANSPPSATATTTPIGTPPPTAAPSGEYYVQLGAFSNANNAQRLANRARSLGAVRIMTAGDIRRVRLGPYATQAIARQALSRARSAGFGDARVLRDTSR